MSHRNNERNVSHTFAANFLFGNFHTTTVADDAFVADAFVFSAVAFIVLYRTEYALAEQTVALWLVGTVVDSFGFENLTTRAFQNFFGRRQAYRYLGKSAFCFVVFTKCHFRCL